jgi:hypothetical protein
MANDSVGVAAAGSPTNYIDNEAISTGGSPATVDRQRVRVGGAGYTDLADVVAGDTGQSGQVVHGSRKEVTFSTTTNVPVAVTDCSNYRWVSVQVTSAGGAASSAFQVSNDNSTWVSFSLAFATNPGASLSNTATNGAGIYFGPVPGRYFRINTAGVSGTFAGTCEFYALPLVPHTLAVAAPNAISVQGGATSGDATSNSNPTLPAQAFGLIYNGATWDRRRTATKFATVEASASGDTAVATPTSGKKIRVLAYCIEVTQDAASGTGADVAIVLRDSTTAIGYGATVFCPATGATTFGPGYHSGWRTVNNGVLSAAANNVLNVNLSAALASGKCRVNVAYCEE